MDAKLAEVYGTNKPDETDVETLAAAELTAKLAAAEEIDTDGLSDEEAESLAQSLIEEGSSEGEDEGGEESSESTEETEEESASENEGEEKTAGAEGELTEEQEKIAEADYFGRIMAHAYAQERREIEKAAAAEKAKTAGEKMNKLKGHAKHMAGKAKEHGGKVMGHLKNHKGKAMGAAAGLAALGAGAAALKHHKSKKAAAEQSAEERMSALDQLAVERANQILADNGVTGEQEKEASALTDDQRAQLAAKVEERAMELLKAEGYEFEENSAEK